MKKTMLLVTAALAAVASPAFAQNTAQNAKTAEQSRADAQAAIDARTPRLVGKEEVLELRTPGYTIGETLGVSMNAAGHLFVYSRSGESGPARGNVAAELFEFDANLKFVKKWAPGMYGASFAHSVRVDAQQNVWMVDEGSNVIVKLDPTGLVKMVLGRKPESIDYLEHYVERGHKDTDAKPVGARGVYGRPADVAFDAAGNIFVADGYSNSRVVKLDKNGNWLKEVGKFGKGDGEFDTVHSIAVDDKGDVYVADRGNYRIQVYDNNLNFKKYITGMGMPWAVAVTPKYIYSGDGNGKLYRMDRDGKLLGWMQTSMNQGQEGCLIHQLHAVSDTVIYKGSCTLWNVEKFTFAQ